MTCLRCEEGDPNNTPIDVRQRFGFGEKRQRSSASAPKIKNDPDAVKKMSDNTTSVLASLQKAKILILKTVNQIPTMKGQKKEFLADALKEAKEVVTAAIDNVETLSLRTTEETIMC